MKGNNIKKVIKHVCFFSTHISHWNLALADFCLVKSLKIEARPFKRIRVKEDSAWRRREKGDLYLKYTHTQKKSIATLMPLHFAS